MTTPTDTIEPKVSALDVLNNVLNEIAGADADPDWRWSLRTRKHSVLVNEFMGRAAIAQQLSRIATSLETITEHLQEITDRERRKG